MNWFKMFAEFGTDPKVQSMTEAMQRRLVMMFCLQCQGELGKLEDDELAAALRITIDDLNETRTLFVRKGFLTDKFDPKNWDKRQRYDPTAAERMKNFRERNRNGSVTQAQQETNNGRTSYDPPHTPPIDTETETEEEKAPRKRGKAAEPPFILPSDIPKNEWDAYEEIRRKIRKPMTNHARWLAVARLHELQAEGNSIEGVLQKAILGSSQGLWPIDPPWQANGKALSKAKPPEPMTTREQQVRADRMIEEGNRLIEESRIKRLLKEKESNEKLSS